MFPKCFQKLQKVAKSCKKNIVLFVTIIRNKKKLRIYFVSLKKCFQMFPKCNFFVIKKLQKVANLFKDNA